MIDVSERVSSGVAGLDDIICGGLPRGQLFLVQGGPGTGKTTLALQFLLAGVARGEKAAFFSIAQSQSELQMIAASHRIDLKGIDIHSPEIGREDRSFSVSTDDTELTELISCMGAVLEQKQPDLFVFDSLLEMRLLSAAMTSYRSELLGLRRRLRAHGATSLVLDHLEIEGGDRHAEGIVHGVIRLSGHRAAAGINHRRLSVIKMRGSAFSEGFHDFRIRQGGLTVFPRVIPSHSHEGGLLGTLAPPQAELAQMLGGGLEYGTITLVSGQSGAGKSTMASVFALAAAQADEKVMVLLFEERPEVFRTRSAGVGIPLPQFETAGKVTLAHFDATETSPGELARAAIRAVEEQGVKLVIIDSISGYVNALPERDEIYTHLYAMMQYLSRSGVLVIATLAQQGLLGEPSRTDVDLSYAADSVIHLRQYQAGQEIRRSIAIIKKRHTEHDRAIQELIIRPGAVEVKRLPEDLASKVSNLEQLGKL